MKRVIIDTDPGDDDAAAILFCLGSGVVQVEALTITDGNVEMEKCARNALMILEAAGRSDIPVYRGASKPLVRPSRTPNGFTARTVSAIPIYRHRKAKSPRVMPRWKLSGA